MTEIQKVAVIGTGVLGAQIMMQAAYHGKTVTGYDISQDLLDRLPDRWTWMRASYEKDLPDFDGARFDDAVAGLRLTTDLKQAVGDADLVIEAIPENLDLKRQVWAQIGAAAPDHTILATNTSSLLPSSFADATGHPERFLALHFANHIWRANTGEVMATARTDPEYFEIVLEFAGEIGLLPIPVRKEVPGYIINTLLIPWLNAAGRLLVDGVATPEAVDEVWRVATGSPAGPFEVFDVVGFNVAMHVSRNTKDEKLQRFADLLEASINQGKAGLATGEGFFTYDEKKVRGPMSEHWKSLSE